MTRSHRNSFLLFDCVSHLTGVILSVKAEHGESDQHVRMGPHTPDHQCCRHGLHFRRRKEKPLCGKNCKRMHVHPRSESIYSYRIPNQMFMNTLPTTKAGKKQ